MNLKVIASLAASLLTLTGTTEAQAQRVATPVQAKLSPWIQRLKTVDVLIDGKTAKMLFDSGGAVTLVSPAFAEKIGCKPYGRLTGFTMTGSTGHPKKCGMRDLQLGSYKTRIDVLAGDGFAPPGAPEIDGIISLNAFEDQAVTIDLGDNLLVLESDASLQQRVANKPGAPIRVMRAMGGLGLTTFARVEGTKGDLWFLIDSNNQARTRVSPGALEELGIAADVVDDAIANSKSIAVPIKVDGVADGPAEVAPKDIIYDGALNERLVYWHNVTLDLKDRKAWFIFDPKPAS